MLDLAGLQTLVNNLIAADQAEKAGLATLLADDIAAFNHLQQVIAGGQPPVDYTAIGALIQARIDAATAALATIQTADAQANIEKTT